MASQLAKSPACDNDELKFQPYCVLAFNHVRRQGSCPDVIRDEQWTVPRGETAVEMHGGVYSLYTLDRPGLLNAVMSALASDTTKISFEGILSDTDLVRITGVTHDESGVLRRATFAPRRDFLVLPLNERTLPAIRTAINSKIAIGEKGIVRVQIVKDGDMAFSAYDSFEKECVLAYPAVSSALLDELTKAKILRGYRQIVPPISRQ